VKYRIGEEVADDLCFALADPMDFTADPTYRAIFEEAVLYCWECYRHDYSPTPERRQFLIDYAAGRFLTMALLNAGWEACKQAEKDYTRSAVLQVNHPATEQQQLDFDSLSDEQIADLRTRTLRLHAQQIRRRSAAN
jgi:hypothetical protein